MSVNRDKANQPLRGRQVRYRPLPRSFHQALFRQQGGWSFVGQRGGPPQAAIGLIRWSRINIDQLFGRGGGVQFLDHRRR
jgi:hypothetical protein